VTENPIADSGTIGITAGAAFGIVALTLLENRLTTTFPMFAYPIAAVLGASLAFLILERLALKQSRTMVQTLLIGVAIASLFNALVTMMQLGINAFEFQKLAVWLSGDVWQTDWTYIISLLVLLGLALIGLPFVTKRLEVLSLGGELATSLGLSVEKTRRHVLIYALFFSGIGVAAVGALGFIGLIAPHIARRLVGFSMKIRLVVTIQVALVIILVADGISKMIIAPSTLPIGFVVALVGAPYFIFLAVRD
jgi:iron complex transport system permease protein